MFVGMLSTLGSRKEIFLFLCCVRGCSVEFIIFNVAFVGSVKAISILNKKQL
jgi:hypothetical protein